MKALPTSMACPLCDEGLAELTEVLQEFRVLNTTFRVPQVFYLCRACNHEYTTTATDELTMLRLKEAIDKAFDKMKNRQP